MAFDGQRAEDREGKVQESGRGEGEIIGNGMEKGTKWTERERVGGKGQGDGNGGEWMDKKENVNGTGCEGRRGVKREGRCREGSRGLGKTCNNKRVVFCLKLPCDFVYTLTTAERKSAFKTVILSKF